MTPTVRDKLRILHADDDESFRLLVRNAIGKHKELSERCDVTLVSDGDEAVERVLSATKRDPQSRIFEPKPHMVILDQRMVRMDGLDALRKIRESESDAHLPVFILSTSDQPSLLKACHELPCAMCICKPLDYAQFMTQYTLIIDFAIKVLELPRRMRD